MTIRRIPSSSQGRCDAVVSDGIAYIVVTDPHYADGIEAQTANCLEELDRLFRRTGTGKAGLVQATVYLSDIVMKPAMDQVWRDWIGPEANWPQRACVGVNLTEGCMIEIVVQAKVLDG